MNKPQIGLVIPIVQKKYIIQLIKQILQPIHDNDIVICVVNDGNNKIINFLINNLPKEVELLNLEKTIPIFKPVPINFDLSFGNSV